MSDPLKKRNLITALLTIAIPVLVLSICMLIVFTVNSVHPAILIGAAIVIIAGTEAVVLRAMFASESKEKTVGQDRYITSFYTILVEIDIITRLFYVLEKIKGLEEQSSFNVRFEKMKGNINKLKEYAVDVERIAQYIEMPNEFDASEIDHKSREINNILQHLNESMVELVEDFTQSYVQNRNSIKNANYSLATLVFYLSDVIPIISDMSQSSNKFAHNIIVDVVAQFEDIANVSNHITAEIGETMNKLMDEGSENSLAFIIRKAHDVVQDFEELFSRIENLKMVSNEFVDTSIEKLNNISDIANSIGEIAETIKVISLNVSIEAANTGVTGKGFQVLARDLRLFAYKTMQFSVDVKSRVADTIQTTERLKEGYIENMDHVFSYVEGTKNSIQSFQRIIENSFDKIKTIIESLKTFSQRISEGIKEIVGKLQYYDISSQEVNHLSQLMSEVFSISTSKAKEYKLGEIISDSERRVIREEILRVIRDMITTDGERNILHLYEEKFGIQLTDDLDAQAIADASTAQDKIFLF